MHDKILQIIPAPADMWAILEGNDPDGHAYRTRERVVCLALIEGRDGTTDVSAMVHDECGYLSPAGAFDDFSGIEYGEVQPRMRPFAPLMGCPVTRLARIAARSSRNIVYWLRL